MSVFSRTMIAVLSDFPCLFVSSVLFTVVSFYFVRKFVDNIHRRFWAHLLFGVINGAAAVVSEILVNSFFPYIIMFFVPLGMVLELLFATKNSTRVYVFIFGAFLINVSGIHSLIVAVIGLLWSDVSSLMTEGEYRVFVFSLVLLTSSCVMLVLSRVLPLRELRAIVYKAEKNLMCIAYMYAAAITLLVTAKFSIAMTYQFQMNEEYARVIYWDMFLKDFMLLIGGYIILLFHCREEWHESHTANLKKDLQLEKDFRSSIQGKALCSYSYNATKGRLDQLHPAFSTYTENPDTVDYYAMIDHYIESCVHPEDKERLRAELVHLDISKKAELKVSSVQFRMSKSAILQSFFDSIEIDTITAHEGEWIWLEARDTYITDAATGDLIVYVDLFNVEDVVQEKAQLVAAATMDALTGLSNRAAMETAVREHLAGGAQDGAFFIIDMDNFKLVNDRFGHPEGDKVLKDVAHIIKSVFRGEDVVARLGGDEFCVYAPGMTSLDAVNRCTATFLTQCRFEYNYNGESFVVTPSIGVAFASQAQHDYGSLYRCADKALYDSKTKGKNCWTLYAEQE